MSILGLGTGRVGIGDMGPVTHAGIDLAHGGVWTGQGGWEIESDDSGLVWGAHFHVAGRAGVIALIRSGSRILKGG